MRRKEKEIEKLDQIEKVIQEAKVCRLGMVDDGMPYIVPMSFGYKDNAFYFHCAKEGRKIDILKKNPNVCFEIDKVIQMITDKDACNWGIKFQSVIGTGTAFFIEEADKKKQGLDIIMSQYSKKSYTYSEKVFLKTQVIKVEVQNMTGKQSL